MIDIEIKKSPGFKIGEIAFTSLLNAQKYAVKELMAGWSGGSKEEIIDWIFNNSTALISVLTSTGRKPRVVKVKSVKPKVVKPPAKSKPQSTVGQEGQPA